MAILLVIVECAASPPSRGAWIEIWHCCLSLWIVQRRPPRGGRGLKLCRCVGALHHRTSPPSRGAWIEIAERTGNMVRTIPRRPPRGGRGLKSEVRQPAQGSGAVAPPRGGRGLKFYLDCRKSGNGQSRPPRGGRGLKFAGRTVLAGRTVSPPSRGAWIEIWTLGRLRLYLSVAPLAGGVD